MATGTAGTGTYAGTTGTTRTTGMGMGAMAGGGVGTFGKVIATIKSAHALRDKAWLGKADPYCVVKVSDAEIQTVHVKNAGDHAVWDESFAFNNVSPDDMMDFTVWDHNRLIKDSHMGTGSISLRQVFEEGRLETRVPLTTKSGTKDAGEVWVSLRCEGGPAGVGAGAATGAATGVATGGAYETERMRTTEAGEAVCGQEYFTKVEDRPVVVEKTTYLQESRPVEKEFVRETRATGVERERMEGRTVETLGTEERIVGQAPPHAPCD